MKREKREVEAQCIIVGYFRGWQVRKVYKPKFRRIAGPKVAAFLKNALVSHCFFSSFLMDRNVYDSGPFSLNGHGT